MPVGQSLMSLALTREGLEPVKHFGGSRGNGHVCEESDGRCDEHTPDGDTLLRAVQ